MPSEQPHSRRIHILREEVARRIAAGEVIDRPFSVARELLDNAIDAGARAVECAVEAGGTRRIQVADDGSGMSREDLEVCTLRHATSKIRDDEDLQRVTTLGFRGEALASIGACSRLEIISRTAEGGPAHRLVVHGGRLLGLEPCEGRLGTRVEVADLFYNLPARRRFLKSQAAETSLCRQALLEKALPHPSIDFRFLADGELKTFLPAGGLKERVAAAAGLEAAHLVLLGDEPASPASAGLTLGGRAPAGFSPPGFRFQAVVGRPEIARPDRRQLQLYVNRRRVFEFAFIQAVEYAFSEYLPGGRHPVAFLFLEVDPELADFNIHPAKREVRLRRLPEMRQHLIALLRAFLKDFALRPAGFPPAEARPGLPARDRTAGAGAGDAADSGAGSPGLSFGGRGPAPVDWLALARRTGAAARGAPEGAPPPFQEPVGLPDSGPGGGEGGYEPRYCGRVFGLFLLAELGERLFIVDQHAAHERLIYERLLARRPQAQELLFPLRLEADEDAEARLRGQQGFLEGELGIRLEPAGPGVFLVTALPEDLLTLPEKVLAEALLGEAGSPQEMKESLYRLAACRLAVKDGDLLDPLAARRLIADALRLPNARCPHGRPIWHAVSREELLRAVGRPQPKAAEGPGSGGG